MQDRTAVVDATNPARSNQDDSRLKNGRVPMGAGPWRLVVTALDLLAIWPCLLTVAPASLLIILGAIFWIVVPAANLLLFGYWCVLLGCLIAACAPLAFCLQTNRIAKLCVEPPHPLPENSAQSAIDMPPAKISCPRTATNLVATCHALLLALLALAGMVCCVGCFINASYAWPAGLADELLAAFITLSLTGVSGAMALIVYFGRVSPLGTPTLHLQNRGHSNFLRCAEGCCCCCVLHIIVGLAFLSAWSATQQSTFMDPPGELVSTKGNPTMHIVCTPEG